MAQIDQQYTTMDNRIGIEVQRRNGAWADAESVFVHPKEDPTSKFEVMLARIAWYRETYPKFTYRLVQKTKVTQRQKIVLDEPEGPTLSVPDDLSGMPEDEG